MHPMPDFDVAYEWLGQYCGSHPQAWLSRSGSAITRFRCRGPDPGRVRWRDEPLLFGFAGTRGFPVDYDFWCQLLLPLADAPDLESANRAVVEHDRVVVPGLDLKAAKTVVYRSERQKKALRRMGFLADRIEIRRP